MEGLKDRVALVTGSGSGIGRGIALRLAAEGSVVAVNDVIGEAATSVAQEIEDMGGRSVSVPGDVAKTDTRDFVLDETRSRVGSVEVLINNAAIVGERRLWADWSDDQWHDVIAVNLTAAALLIRACVPDMIRKGRGSIVNVSSIQALFPAPTYVAYSASKGGLESLTRALAVELAASGVRVNAVQPGPITSESTRIAFAAAEQLSSEDGGLDPPTLLGRMGRAEEVAAAVAFLSSDESSFVTGTILRVDGGRLLSRKLDPLASFGDQGTGV